MTNLAESDQAILAASAMRETTADGTALIAKWGGRWLTLALVAAAYIAAALPGMLVALSPGYASLWPAAGLALAALLVLGPRSWPGVWLGAFLVDLWLDVSVTGAAVAALIATGATLRTRVGARLTWRSLASAVPLTRDADVRRFLLLGGPLACLVMPTLGVATLYGFGRLAAADLVSQWLTWGRRRPRCAAVRAAGAARLARRALVQRGKRGADRPAAAGHRLAARGRRTRTGSPGAK